jgi:hypothetical protein
MQCGSAELQGRHGGGGASGRSVGGGSARRLDQQSSSNLKRLPSSSTTPSPDVILTERARDPFSHTANAAHANRCAFRRSTWSGRWCRSPSGSRSATERDVRKTFAERIVSPGKAATKTSGLEGAVNDSRPSASGFQRSLGKRRRRSSSDARRSISGAAPSTSRGRAVDYATSPVSSAIQPSSA